MEKPEKMVSLELWDPKDLQGRGKALVNFYIKHFLKYAIYNYNSSGLQLPNENFSS